MKTRLSLSALLIALLAWPALASPPLDRPGPASHDAIGVTGRSQAAGTPAQPVYLDRGVVSDAYLYGGDRLTALQNADGGWGWPLTGLSALNTIGPIGKGLARACLHTLDADHLAALGQTGALLLTKTNNFSPSDGYLAAQLDAIFSVSTYVAHVTANFYDPLAAGTYDRLGLGTLYTTATYVQFIRDNRTGSQANLAAWDIGMGLVGAVAAGADQTAWIAGAEAEINELSGAANYDVIGLAGALYGLAAAGVAFDPSGQHAAAESLADLATILVTYQIAGGGFAWRSDYVIPNDSNETIQETAYAILALDAVNPTTYAASIEGASLYLLGVQLATGGWENYPGNGENNEVTGEALWGIDVADPEITEVWVDDDFNSSTPGWDVTHFASIQDGIDAVSGSTVNVAPGTYTEQLHITTNDLAIVGAGVGVTIVKAPASCPAYFITSTDVENHPVVFIDGVTGVSLSGLTIDGDHQGTANYRFSGLAFWNAGGSLTDAEVLNVMDTAFSGTQHGVGIYAYNTTGGPYTIALNDVQVFDFQKNGLALLGEGLTVDLDGVTTTGEGPTAVTAQNGIQIGLGASGTVDNCGIAGIAYTGGYWTATGLLLDGGGTVAATDVDIDGCQTSVYWIDTNGSYDGSAITNPIGDAYYAYSTGGAKSAGQPRVAAQPLAEDYKTAGGRSAVTATVTNSTITGTGLTDSWGVGVWGYGPLDFTVTGCTVTNWDYGVVCYDAGGAAIDAVINDNDIHGNTSFGVYTNTVGDTQDATDNWWGHASGPYHLVANPYGLGDPVSDFVDFDPFAGQAVFGIAASTTGPINCSQSSTLTFSYTPDVDSPAMRGCSVRIPVSPYLAFTEADFHVNPALYPTEPGGASSFFDVTYDAGEEAYTVDYGILGATPGITAAVDLFTLVVDGAATGSGVVMVDSCSVRDLVNQPIGADCSDAETILVDCTAPDLPEMVAEPAFTQGLTNTMEWSDESASGAVAYYAECATDAGFAAVIANTGWIAGLAHEFTGLADATPYWYRVKAKDALDNETGWSAAESSTQDAAPPATSADALAAYQNALTFDVAWTGSDATSGLASVELFFTTNGGGSWTSYGVFAASPIGFTALADGTYGFYTVGTDVVGNVEAASAGDATTIVDTTFPLGSFAINSGAGHTNALSVTLANAVTDLNPLDMRFSNDGTSWSSWTAYAASQAWTLAAGADGLRWVYAEFRDAAQNVLPLSDSIVYDTTAPGMASAINAEPRHEEVHLTWTNPTDGDLAGLEIWRAFWHDGALNSAYPEYGSLTGDVFPGRPADRANAWASPEWDLVYTAAPSATSYTDPVVIRGIYIYEIFPKDLAGNFGPRAVTGNDYATNYWLGDVFPGWDGNVHADDVTTLAVSYGLTDGETGYDNDCDVGPTTHPVGSGLGIPLTDDTVGFEDLMIFALNYWVVSPKPIVQGSDIAMLSWFEMEDGVWGLGLTEPCASLKALQLKAALPAGVEAQLTGGSLLTQQAGPIFLRQIPGDGLDVSLAVLGEGLVISGQGLLFSVTLPAGVLPGDVELTVRDAANAELAFALSATAVEDLPTVYRLAGNYPNPFNPKTTISFDLPEAQFVRLAVFSADGRRIATLLSQQMAAGRHVAIWDGRDAHGDQVASGVYFARIEAGPLNETHKMLLMK